MNIFYFDKVQIKSYKGLAFCLWTLKIKQMKVMLQKLNMFTQKSFLSEGEGSLATGCWTSLTVQCTVHTAHCTVTGAQWLVYIV